MTRIRRRALVTALALVFLAGTEAAVWTRPAGAEGTSREQAQLESVRDKISETRDRISQKRQQEKSLLRELQATEQELEAAQTKLARIERELRATTARVAELQRQLVMAQADLQAAEKDLSGHYDRFSRRLRAIYQAGPLNYLEIIFTAENFSDLMVRLELMQRLIASDVELFNQVRNYKARVEAEKERIQKTKKELEQRQSQITALRRETAAETNRIKAKVRERAAMLRKIESERKAYEAALDEWEATARQLESFIRGQQKRGPGTSQAAAKNMLWPVRGRVTSDFGWRVHPVFRSRRFHSGLDIAAPHGTPVAAAAGGTVILSGWVGGYGKTVIIDHGGGISTLYGHNSTLLVKEGELVRAGQTIAKVGSTGISTGPHVHFEVRRDGEAVNPRDWLR
ncbi:MAG: peptidoglycan DD-metalloendopeptidase family protein [Bacillota bacterium]|nr:peptidoglycan DD-metalloendopeptidase family protein [Bacillota bacterium]